MELDGKDLGKALHQVLLRNRVLAVDNLLKNLRQDLRMAEERMSREGGVKDAQAERL